MVYLAAQAGAQHFIEIVFGTSAGQIVSKSYKDRTPLPEDVARANGHEELAQYLQDINKRCVKFHSEYPASTSRIMNKLQGACFKFRLKRRGAI